MKDKSRRKTKASSGIIRKRAGLISLIIIISALIYFKFLLDSNIKKLMEAILTNMNGAEVKIGAVQTSLISGKVSVKDLSASHPSKPELNSYQVKNIDFDFSLATLARGKFISNELSVNGIRVNARKEDSQIKMNPKAERSAE
ncbi:MAG: hypothetical protein HQK54_00580, partial [Oligoflexales bacterium]|nr:hypothetical protein [Oligoflexales bacterium]